MSAMQELDLETLRFPPRGRSVHLVKDRSGGDSPRFAYTFCGRSAHEANVIPQKFSAVRANDWCLPCYWNRHKAINREFGVSSGDCPMTQPHPIQRQPEPDDDAEQWADCNDCNGYGWDIEPAHAPGCDGECSGACPVPVQVRCPSCDGVGQVLLS